MNKTPRISCILCFAIKETCNLFSLFFPPSSAASFIQIADTSGIQECARPWISQNLLQCIQLHSRHDLCPSRPIKSKTRSWAAGNPALIYSYRDSPLREIIHFRPAPDAAISVGAAGAPDTNRHMNIYGAYRYVL